MILLHTKKQQQKKRMGTELIMGMEEVINYLKQLEEENKKLKEENKKLKEQEQEYQPKGSQIDPEGLHDYMKEENEELKEENNKLNKMIKYLPNDMEDKWWCEKNEKWRWEGDGYDEDYEEPDSP